MYVYSTQRHAHALLPTVSPKARSRSTLKSLDISFKVNINLFYCSDVTLGNCLRMPKRCLVNIAAAVWAAGTRPIKKIPLQIHELRHHVYVRTSLLARFLILFSMYKLAGHTCVVLTLAFSLIVVQVVRVELFTLQELVNTTNGHRRLQISFPIPFAWVSLSQFGCNIGLLSHFKT